MMRRLASIDPGVAVPFFLEGSEARLVSRPVNPGSARAARPRRGSAVSRLRSGWFWPLLMSQVFAAGVARAQTSTDGLVLHGFVPPVNTRPVASLRVRVLPPGAITDPDTVLPVPAVARPPYLSPRRDPTFGAPVRRVTGDAGTTFPLPGGAKGTWGSDARHHYSKDEPWSSDGSLIAIDNNGGTPIEVFLDGNDYTVARGRCPNYISGEDRWHPSPLHPHERINVLGTELMWFDVVDCVKTRSWTLPFPVLGIGPGEGNTSNDGRFIALTDGVRAFVVDMDPQPPFAPYPASRIGPAVDVSNCGLADGCAVGWVSASASGKYVVVKYVNDHPRVYDVNPATLALAPRPMPATEVQCSSGSPAQGYIYDLGHADLALNPYDDDEDVLVGQEHCGNHGRIVDGKRIGGVMMVRLRDGAITPLTDPTNEGFPHHVSMRSIARPGWAYVDYYPKPGTRYDDEIVAVKLDGSGAMQRFAHKHSVFTGCYHCESHAVPSTDGRRMVWASNWAGNCTTCGAAAEIHAYVLDARNVFDPDTAGTRSATLDGSGSRDPDGTIASYHFLFGDGRALGPQRGSSAAHDYRRGAWRASVTVADNFGAKDSAAVAVAVPTPDRPPRGTIVAPAADVTIAAGHNVTLTGAATDPDSNLPLHYLWDLGGGAHNFTTQSPGPVTFNNPGTFVVRFLVTDAPGLDDPRPPSVRVTVTPAGGRAPVVTAPAAVSGTELKTLSLTVTAADPDGDPITSLTANLAGLPPGSGAVFTPNATNTAGTLTWTPSANAGRAAPYIVTFTAVNTLRDSVATAITIADIYGRNLVMNSSFESDTKGWASSGKASFWRVAGGQSGAWALQIQGPATLGTFGMNDSPNTVDSTLRAGTRYRFRAWVRSAGSAGKAKLRVREYSGTTQVGTTAYSAPVTLSPGWQPLALDYQAVQAGTALDFQVLDDPLVPGEAFLLDNVSAVIVPPGGTSAVEDDSVMLPDLAATRPLAASITPHPVSGASTLRFATSRPGPLRVSLLDIGGRRVRTLIDERDAPAGQHGLTISSLGADGTRLPAGIYFYRIEAAEGMSHGRFVVLK